MNAIEKRYRNVRGTYRGLMPCAIIMSTVVAMLFPSTGVGQEAKTADELIAQAHKHDNMYTLGPQASQQRALAYYREALAAEPDDKQRLHILHRMAQLYGSAYQLEKGEKPDFLKAISLYTIIVESYPPNEPLVFDAMFSIGDHYATLWQFTDAIEWFKRPLEYDLSDMEKSLETLRESRKRQEAAMLEATIQKIKKYQEIALRQVVYAAEHIHPQLRTLVLRSLADKYPGTAAAEQAQRIIAANAAQDDELGSLFDGETLQPNVIPAAKDRPVTQGQADAIAGRDVAADKVRGSPSYRLVATLFIIAIGTLVIGALIFKSKRTPVIRT